MLRSRIASVFTRRSGLFWLLVSLLVVIPACGGSGGSGGSGNGESSLTQFALGRGVTNESGKIDVMSPLTFASSVDLDTGLADAHSVEPIGNGIDVNQLVTLPLDYNHKPPIIPRNSIMVLSFGVELDPASVTLDTMGPDGQIVTPGSLQIRNKHGHPVHAKIRVQGDRILINPVLPDRVGWPKSPTLFDLEGDVVADEFGFLSVTFDKKNRLLSTRGRPIGTRPDLMGEQENPLTFNPGNFYLDFIQRGGYFPNPEHYRGFLPDQRSPRLIRDHVVENQLNFNAGDTVSLTSITDIDAHFSARAKNGEGEWSGTLLTLRPDTPKAESHRVVRNSEDTLVLKTPIAEVRDGDIYRLSRIEVFEPDPGAPIDPDIFDPYNPENSANQNLATFLEIRALDREGNPTGPVLDPLGRVPSLCQIAWQFDEPMNVDSLLAFENLMVQEIDASGTKWTPRRGTITTEDHQRRVIFRPVQVNESTGEVELFGLGPKLGERRVQLITAPTQEYLEGRYRGDLVRGAMEEGYRALIDLAGRPLSFSDGDYRIENAHVSYETIIGVEADNTLPEESLIVQTFRGMPVVEINPETQRPGVQFRDEKRFYGPHIVDFNLEINGFLSGKPPRHYQQVFDDENPVPDRDMNPWPFGAGTPLGGYVKSGKNYATLFGVRFQQIYRNKEVSPFPGAEGLPLELWRVSWAPAGGHVSEPPDCFEDVQIRVTHSSRVPTSGHKTGLGIPFDPESYDNSACSKTHSNGPNYDYDDEEYQMTEVVEQHTKYTVSYTNIFSPEDSTRNYIGWPTFQNVFRYDNSRSVVLDVRIRPQETMIGFANSFTFSVLQLGWPRPYIRIWSIGDQNNHFDPYNTGDKRAVCAKGPAIGQNTIFGDNSIYFTAFDWTQTKSILESPWFDAAPNQEIEEIEWLDPIINPPLSAQPPNTTAQFQYQGQNNSDESGWVSDITELSGFQRVRFRVVVFGDFVTSLVPTFDHIVLPHRIP